MIPKDDNFFALELSELIKVNRLVRGGINLKAFNSCDVAISAEERIAPPPRWHLPTTEPLPYASFSRARALSSTPHPKRVHGRWQGRFLNCGANMPR